MFVLERGHWDSKGSIFVYMIHFICVVFEMPRKRKTSTELFQLFDEVSDGETENENDISYLPVRPPRKDVPVRYNYQDDDDLDYDDLFAR